MPSSQIGNKRYVDTGLLGQYAGFVSRAAALIIDILVVIVLVLVVYWAVWLPLDFFLNISPATCAADNLAQRDNQLLILSCRLFDIATKIVSLLAAPAYFTFMYTSMGQTIGMYILGIRVVRLDGKPMTVLGSLWRYAGLIVSMLAFGLGFLWVLFDDRRQSWADKMAGTCVIYAWRAEQNDFLLARVRRFLTGRTWLRRGKPAPLPATTGAYDLITIAFNSYDRLDDILNKIQGGIATGEYEIINATVLVKGEDGAIGVLAASDLSVGNRVRQMAAEPLSLPDYELRRILTDVPADSFVIAVVLLEQYGDALIKEVSRMTATMIRRFDLGETPSPANLGRVAPSALPAKRTLPPPAAQASPAPAPASVTASATAGVRTLTATPTTSLTAPGVTTPSLQANPAPPASSPAVTAPPPAPAIQAPVPAAITLPAPTVSGATLPADAEAVAASRPAPYPQIDGTEAWATAVPGIYPLPDLAAEPKANQGELTLETSDDVLEAAAYAVIEAEETPPFTAETGEPLASELHPTEEMDALAQPSAEPFEPPGVGYRAGTEPPTVAQPVLDAQPAVPAVAATPAIEELLTGAPAGNGQASTAFPAAQTAGGQRAAKTVADAVAVEIGVEPGRTDRLQDLTEVKFIGAAYAQRLYRAGIGTYWELANAPDDVLRAALRLTETQDATFPYRGVRADARRLAEATDTLGLTWDAIALDDFEPLKGIGKVFELRLYRGGILTYAHLAAATPDELAAICNAQPPLNPDFASWIEQAQALARQPLRHGSEGL